uniref:Bromodomain adjacent to zinc finger domain protein 2B n=1 Tax=Trichuris muris TaxID=70415 RepID=A0A5S6QHF0_TRIMR
MDDATTMPPPSRTEENTAISETSRSKRAANDSPPANCSSSSSSMESQPSNASGTHSVLMTGQAPPQPPPPPAPMNPFFAAFLPPFIAGANGGFWQSQMPSAADYFYLASLFGGGGAMPPINAAAPSGCPNGESGSFPDLLRQLSMARQKKSAVADQSALHNKEQPLDATSPLCRGALRPSHLSPERQRIEERRESPFVVTTKCSLASDGNGGSSVDDEESAVAPIDFSKKRISVREDGNAQKRHCSSADRSTAVLTTTTSAPLLSDNCNGFDGQADVSCRCSEATTACIDVCKKELNVPISNATTTNGLCVATTNETISSNSGTANMQLDQNLLNASAVAWAALSNQLFLSSLQSGMFMNATNSPSILASTYAHEQSPSSSSSSMVHSQSGYHRSVGSSSHRGRAYSGGGSGRLGRRRGSRGRPATISVDESSEHSSSGDNSNSRMARSSLDDTIDNVVNCQRDMAFASDLVAAYESAAQQQYHQFFSAFPPHVRQFQKSSVVGRGRGRMSSRGASSRRCGRGSRGGYTVREQLALRRGEVTSSSSTEKEEDEEANDVIEQSKSVDAAATLDLSMPHSTLPCVNYANSSQRISQETIATTSGGMTSSDGHRKPMVDLELLRVPLAHGWRRQTIIRHISPSGVRGDVLYYAPCGKRLGSYAEVIRYLRKQGISTMSRENFSLSSKIVVGEFLYNKQDGIRNGLVRLSDAEVVNIVKQLKKLSTASTSSCRSSSAGSRSRGAMAAASVKRRNVGTRALLRQKVINQLKGVDNNKVDNVGEQSRLKRQQAGQEVRRAIEQVNKQREEQRKLDLQGKLARFRQMRVPVEDLEIEQTKRLPQFSRIPNLQLDGGAFADLLLVMHFLATFGDVLKIDKEEIPSLSAMHAGLLNDPNHRQSVVSLTKILLTLVLEYPGLPSGNFSRTCTGQPLRELAVTNSNYSELLRMFLASRRDRNGPEMAAFLENASFERLEPSIKSRILAYMCDELLYCRNVVREIENSIEVLAKLKSDKWAIKGKIRSLRTLRSEKLKKSSKTPTGSESKTNDDDEEEEDCAQGTSGAVKSEREACFEHELTSEERALQPDQIDQRTELLSKEVEKMRFTISDSSCKIRCLPLGQDRFQRYYWTLPEYGGILLESVESSCRSNPALNRRYLKPELLWQDGSGASLHVRQCVDWLVNTVASGQTDDHQQGSSKFSIQNCPMNGCAHSDDEEQRGWWIVESVSQFDALSQSLNQKGIRERLFNRSLIKHGELCKEGAFRGQKRTASLDAATPMGPGSLSEELKPVFDSLVALEEKCYQANIHVNGWTPGDPNEYERLKDLTDEDRVRLIQGRLLNLERNIEHRYFLPFVNNSQMKLISSPTRIGEPAKVTAIALNESDEHPSVPAQLTTWRGGVIVAQTAAKLYMCIDALESFVAWEKSIMKASCQICRDDNNESQLLLCDGCDLGYHTYCFKPKMEKVPDEDWYCPECVAKATRRSCCLICCRHSSLPMITCSNCKREFHFDCLGLEPSKKFKSDWLCQGCSKVKNTGRKIAVKRSNAVAEQGKKVTVEAAKKHKPSNEKRTNSKTKKADSAVTYSRLEYEEICGIILAELDAHKDSWPFKLPVDTKVIPLYKRVIKRPMDLSTIHSKLITHVYQKSEDFIKDVNLIFDNCQTFNEDDSKIGKAGHCLRRFFNRRWKELTDAVHSRRSR